jgi:hypothetical protein
VGRHEIKMAEKNTQMSYPKLWIDRLRDGGLVDETL